MYYSSLGHLLCIRNGKVMNKMLNNTISIPLIRRRRGAQRAGW